MLEDRNWKRPDADADAAAIAHFRADRATVLAKELTAIAEATDKLQKVLTPDQRKIFNQVSRLSMHELATDAPRSRHAGWKSARTGSDSLMRPEQGARIAFRSGAMASSVAAATMYLRLH